MLVPGNETYRLATPPTNYNTGILLLGSQPSVSTLPGTSDASVYDRTSMVLQRYMNRSSVGGNNGNEFVAAFQCTTPSNTSSSASYQKGPIYARMTHYEESVYSPSFIGKDAVGIESQVALETPSNGRGWAMHGLVHIPSGRDGYAVGMEVEILNSGTTQGNPVDEQRSKAGYMAVMRNGVGTRAIGIWGQPGGGAAGSWQHGIVFNPAALNTGGTAMIFPNNMPICTWNPGAFPSAYTNILYSNTDNVLVLGSGSASISMVPAVNCLSTIAATELVAIAAASAGSAGQLRVGNSTAATAGTVSLYLEVFVGSTKYKIPLHANS